MLSDTDTERLKPSKFDASLAGSTPMARAGERIDATLEDGYLHMVFGRADPAWPVDPVFNGMRHAIERAHTGWKGGWNGLSERSVRLMRPRAWQRPSGRWPHEEELRLADRGRRPGSPFSSGRSDAPVEGWRLVLRLGVHNPWGRPPLRPPLRSAAWLSW